MLILYPRLKTGNVLWTCDNCGWTTEVTCIETNAVALHCTCDNTMHPKCNDKWYNKGLYFQNKKLTNTLNELGQQDE